MNRDNCRHCTRPILLCRIRGGRWLPFDVETIEAAPDAIDAYVPVRTGRAVAMVPVSDVADRRLVDVHRYAKQHRCVEFLRAVAERRYNVSTMADVAEDLLNLWGIEPLDAKGAP